MSTKKMGLNEAIKDAVEAMLNEDDRVVLFGEDVESGFGSAFVHVGLHDKYGSDRVFNTPINESLIAYIGVGMALGGMLPIAELSHQDFSTLSFDALVNTAAKIRFWSNGKECCPLTFIAPGGMGAMCGPNHQQTAEGWFANIPGLKLVVPTSPADAKGLMRTAVYDTDPVLFFIPRCTAWTPEDVPVEQYSIPFGQARVAHEGTDVTVVAWQLALVHAMDLVDEMAAEGISVEVIDPRTLVPLDRKGIIKSVRKTGRLVVAHEAWKNFGPACEIITSVTTDAFDALKAPPVRVATEMYIPSFVLERDVAIRKADVKLAIYQAMGDKDRVAEYREEMKKIPQSLPSSFNEMFEGAGISL